jgi:multiple sugar transport system permease protein
MARAELRPEGLVARVNLRWQSAGDFAVFVLPTIAAFTAVVLAPILWTLLIGFTDERASRPAISFIGLDNYRALVASASFQQVLTNTVVVTLIVVVGTNLLGLAIALLLRKQSRLNTILRGIYFTPVILSAVVVSVIWRSLLVDSGLVNTVLRSLGVLHPPGWLTDPSIALYTIATIIMWQMLGFAVVVYLAGLTSIPVDLDEAASIDGASPAQRFRFVTWPLLAPAFTIVTVMLMISSFKVFDQVAVLTNGGPGTRGTATIAFEVIRTAFTDQRAGYASAMAGIMLLIVGAASALTLYLLRRREISY